jgi:hypothetical protein
VTNAGSTGFNTPGPEPTGEPVRAEAAVVRPRPDHRGGRGFADCDPARLRYAVSNRGQRRCVLRVERRFLSGEQRHEDAAGRCYPGRFLGVERRRQPRGDEVSLVAAVDCIHRVVHGAVHHRQMQHRLLRRLPDGDEDRAGRVQVPFHHRVGAREGGRRERDCRGHRHGRGEM